ncbi:hypothetical protein [Nocardia jinanensis]|uniref:Uncharacterized protein n=1 Tax=Nocardia jinanensis TaxID=382504 RepID=A0A917RQA3_9NOCA|nr:hypothetical protein [Nocardia jinanensis]GGL18481.1 hypothetical protein GCM10011588_36380 [Nocardia jinanensis]
MPRELKADLNLLESASKGWLNEAAPELRKAAGAVEDLKFSAVEFGPLFVGAWNAYSQAAAFIQDRLNEGAVSAEQVGNALHATVVSFGMQEQANEQALNQVAGDMGFQI